MDLFIFLFVIAISSLLMSTLSKYKTNPNKSELIVVKVKNYGYRIIIFFSVLIPALLVGCRGLTVGSDTKGTAFLFFQNSVVGDNVPLELFYWIISKIGYFIIPNYNGMLIAVAFVTLSFAFYTFAEYRYVLNPGISTFIYLCLFIAPMCNILRQSLAAAIFLYSIKYIHEKKIYKYSLFIILAGLVHTSAYLLIVVYPLYHLAMNTKYRSLRFLVIIAALTSPYWITFVYQNISTFSIFNNYSKYDAMFTERSIAVYNFTIRYSIYFSVIIFILYVWHNKKWGVYILKKSIPIFWFYPFLEAMGILCTGNMKWAFRIMYYFTIGYPLLNAYLCSNLKNRYRIFYCIFTCGAFLYYFIVFHYLWGNDAIFPYISCF